MENIQTNTGLIKRRIRTNSLKSEEIVLGRKTKTTISINYLDDVANIENVNLIKERLKNIDVDGVIDISTIIHYIESENKTVFPTIKRTERPDLTANALLEGKIILFILYILPSISMSSPIFSGILLSTIKVSPNEVLNFSLDFTFFIRHTYFLQKNFSFFQID